MSAPEPPPPRPGAGWDAIDRRIAPTPAGETEAPDPRCHVCGTPLAADQTYCLECGSPTSLAPRFPRRRSGTALVAAALVVLGVGTGALAYAVSGDDEPRTGTTGTTVTTAPLAPPSTAPFSTTATTTTAPGVPGVGPLPPDTSVVPVPPPSATFPTVTSGTGGQVPDVPPAETDTDPNPVTPADPGSELDDEGLSPGSVPGLPGFDPDDVEPLVPGGGGEDPAFDDPPDDLGGAGGADETGGASDWPLGREAWTVQVASSRSRADVEAVAARLRAAGEPAGILISGDHPELVPGFFVAFSGVYGPRASAIAQAGGLGPSFPGAFAREISG